MKTFAIQLILSASIATHIQIKDTHDTATIGIAEEAETILLPYIPPTEPLCPENYLEWDWELCACASILTCANLCVAPT